MNASSLRLCGSCFVIGLIMFSLAPDLECQEQISPSNDTSKISPPEDFSIRIGVEEVRLDAVAVDNKGRQITDLTADDFEIYQDGKPQKITAAKYISNQKEFRTGPSPSHALAREDVRLLSEMATLPSV